MGVKNLVMGLMGLLVVLATSGCSNKNVVVTKPTRVVIEPAKVEQCRYADTVDNVKCVMVNYINVRAERDKLRNAYEEITE